MFVRENKNERGEWNEKVFFPIRYFTSDGAISYLCGMHQVQTRTCDVKNDLICPWSRGECEVKIFNWYLFTFHSNTPIFTWVNHHQLKLFRKTHSFRTIRNWTRTHVTLNVFPCTTYDGGGGTLFVNSDAFCLYAILLYRLQNKSHNIVSTN